jgi:secretion/DNA translocation related TadE-like protein
MAVVWSIFWMFACIMVGGLAAVGALAEARQHAVDASADLVSLSAAAGLQHGHDACEMAATVAAANSVTLARCSIEGSDVVVEVRTRLDLPFGLHPDVYARARAGPP